MPEFTITPGPVELFDRMQRHWMENTGGLGTELTDDAVLEIPFAAEGMPRRLEGAEAIRRFTGPEQAAFAQQYRLEEIRNVMVHETIDPDVIVVEYELAGTVVATGHRAASSFIGVLRARNGKIALWREYQNPLVMAEVIERVRNA